MSTGLFTHRGHNLGSTIYFAQRKGGRRVKGANPALDNFAEALSEHDLETGDKGGDLKTVAARLGISHAYANALLQRLRKKLGGQAI